MIKSISSSLLLSFALTAACATSADAFIEKRHFDRYYGTRALEVADPSGGPIAPFEPSQSVLEEDFEVEWGGYTITAVHGFGIEALVLGRKDYTQGDFGALLPIDLALAWGQVSDPKWVQHLRIEQSDRVYRWSYPRGTPLNAEVVALNSANMHIMPASPDIQKKLDSVARGDVVRLAGFLVDITMQSDDGAMEFEWLTSRVRTDTGLGACEVILVTSVEIEGR